MFSSPETIGSFMMTFSSSATRLKGRYHNPGMIATANVVLMEISPVVVTMKATILAVSVLREALDVHSCVSAKTAQIHLGKDLYWVKGTELCTHSSILSQVAKYLLKNDLRK